MAALVSVGVGFAAPAGGVAQATPSSAPRSSAQPARADSGCPGCPRPRPLLAALTVTGSNIFINRFDTWVLKVYDPVEGYWTRVSPRTWGANIRSGWVWDTDHFTINMFGHPYQGGSYFRAGRTHDLNFWESVPLTFLGSVQWEYFGETTKPSLNDLYNTGFGGIVVGEAVYRLVLLIRDNQSRGAGRVLRELAAFPFDPAGGLRRIVAGDFMRVYANPGDRAPPPIALQLQTGVRQARDSGVAGTLVRRGAVVAELSYGDFFRTYGRPFDVFLARALISPGSNPLGELRLAGRLYAREFTNPAAPIRTIFTVRQKLEYIRNPAYRFGGQSLEAGVVAGFSLGRGVELRAEGYAEGILMGAADAPGAGVSGTPRTYDFGPGVGSEVVVSIQRRHFPVFSARYHWSRIHSVSGSPADHLTHQPSVEAALPLTRVIGLGAYAGWYTRRSAYTGGLSEVTTHRDLRAYVVWRSRPRPATPAPQ
jgi:uncharacterized protein DUF3943